MVFEVSTQGYIHFSIVQWSCVSEQGECVGLLECTALITLESAFCSHPPQHTSNTLIQSTEPYRLSLLYPASPCPSLSPRPLGLQNIILQLHNNIEHKQAGKILADLYSCQ